MFSIPTFREDISFISGEETTSCCTNHKHWRSTTIPLLQNQSAAPKSSPAQHPQMCHLVLRAGILDTSHTAGLTNLAHGPVFPHPTCASNAFHQPSTTSTTSITSLLPGTFRRMSLFSLLPFNIHLNLISHGKTMLAMNQNPV